LELEGVKTILSSEWNRRGETEDTIIIQHDSLREGMLLEDWEAAGKSSIPRIKIWVKDNQEHPLFLSISATPDIIASQISEQLGYTILAENLKEEDGTPWNGRGDQYQKIYIYGFWRWGEEKKNERFNVSQTNTIEDMKNQLTRLKLNPTDYEIPTEKGEEIIVRLKNRSHLPTTKKTKVRLP
jgi:hypothetical protein